MDTVLYSNVIYWYENSLKGSTFELW